MCSPSTSEGVQGLLCVYCSICSSLRHLLLYLILVCTPMSAQRGAEGQSQCLSLLLSTWFFETGSLWAWCSLTDSQANRLVSSRKLSCLWPSRDGTTGTQYHAKIFMWLLGFWTQVAQHALYTESHLSGPPLLILWAPNQSLCLFLFLSDCVFLFCGSRISVARARTLQYSHLNSEIHFSSELATL